MAILSRINPKIEVVLTRTIVPRHPEIAYILCIILLADKWMERQTGRLKNITFGGGKENSANIEHERKYINGDNYYYECWSGSD